VEEAWRDVRELERLLDDSAGDGRAGASGARFRKLSHDLRGTGGGYGFPAITARAAELEDAFLRGAAREDLRSAVAGVVGAVQEAAAAVGIAPSDGEDASGQDREEGRGRQ
jgi:HPt (histidine-containing phosphotransfer) domain-containing protein